MSIKVGIVGTGNVARNNYLPFLSCQEDVSLVYYSRTRSRAVRFSTVIRSSQAGCSVMAPWAIIASRPCKDSTPYLAKMSSRLRNNSHFFSRRGLSEVTICYPLDLKGAG